MQIIACPGQGSQTPGFLNEWLELEGAETFLGNLSEAAKIDLIKHGTTSDADTIRDTSIAQPLIVAASLLAWEQLKQYFNETAFGVAGHSVGEFAAAAIAGIITPVEALQLVGVRGKAMAEAAAQAETSMSAVVGGKEDDVLAAIDRYDLSPANINGGGQIVAAGLKSSLSLLADDAPRGARVIPLQVAGAFHTEFMRSAIDPLEKESQTVTPNDPSVPIWTNYDGSLVSTGNKYLNHLVTQIASPVRWDLCMQSFTEAEAAAFIELTPAGALTGIAKRAMRGTPTAAVKTPADINAVLQLLENK